MLFSYQSDINSRVVMNENVLFLLRFRDINHDWIVERRTSPIPFVREEVCSYSYWLGAVGRTCT